MALLHLKEKAETATYFKFELGLHYFLKNEWKAALEIFKGIAAQSFTKKFLTTQVSEVEALAKSMKLSTELDLSKTDETFADIPIENMCIFPSPIQLCVKLACCYFNLDQYNMGMKWLLSTILIHKKHVSIQSKIEDEFYHLALKYLNRTSMKMLTYETTYFLKHFPRLPDEKLEEIIKEIDAFRLSVLNDLGIISKTRDTNKENSILADFISSTLIMIVSYCLIGETELACNIYESSKLYLYKNPDQFSYLLHHIEYWVGRAFIEDNRVDEAKEVLKASLKKKKCHMNISHKVRQVLAGIEE